MEGTGAYVLAHDLGTSGNKACLYRLGDKIELVGSHLVEYPLSVLPGGGVEQRADDWWNAVCQATRALLERTGVPAPAVKGLAFCSQLQGSVLVDRDGRALRNPMIYLDGRAQDQLARHLYTGLVRVGKWNAAKTVRSLIITGGLAGTAKDPLWKYLWVKENEPEVFARAAKWIDVKDYMTLRCTGRLGMTYDSAHLTWVFDTRPGRLKWSEPLCRLFGVNMDHLPPVIRSTDIIGPLTPGAAAEMGLEPGLPVFGGGGDTSLIAIGSGATDLYDTHVYIGTSGWVAATVDRRMVDATNFVASVLGGIPGGYLYVAEQETAGACLRWVRDHLALDEIGVYLGARHVADPARDRPACGKATADKIAEYESLYAFLSKVVEETEPGAGGLIFAPWLHGNRSPREDPFARGMFFNLGLDTGKRQMVRAVLEGVAYHIRWMLEAVERRIPRQGTLRLAGGGAKSHVWCQIVADVTGRRVEVVGNAQDAGTIGAAIVAGVGLGLIGSFREAKALVAVERTFEPRPTTRTLYDRQYDAFRNLYASNRKLFRKLNAQPASG